MTTPHAAETTGNGAAKSGSGNRRTISVSYLARVEGEGALHLATHGDRVTEARLEIFEPPRLFEGFLRGRDHREVPDVTARICGICPVAYQMSSCHALEAALGVDVGREEPALRALRRILYCAEWIESHALHVYMLHAPDFLGYESGIHMAADHPEEVERGLALKKVGNDLMAAVGGRAVHPVNVRVGGFYRAPSRAELEAQLEALERALEMSVQTAHWVAGFDFPDLERNDVALVAMTHPDEYPFNEGRLAALAPGGRSFGSPTSPEEAGAAGRLEGRGPARQAATLEIDFADYERYFEEEHVLHSTSLHAHMKGGGGGNGGGRNGLFLVGPLARYALNADKLTPRAAEVAREVGLDPGTRNPFRSIVVRAVETVFACEEAIRLIRDYRQPERSWIDAGLRAGEGAWITEAPRGILYHRYRIDDRGLVEEARIVPPTSQNQPAVEADLVAYAQKNLHLPDDQLQWRCEQVIRNYDPCISCSCHFLKLERRRE